MAVCSPLIIRLWNGIFGIPLSEFQSPSCSTRVRDYNTSKERIGAKSNCCFRTCSVSSLNRSSDRPNLREVFVVLDNSFAFLVQLVADEEDFHWFHIRFGEHLAHLPRRLRRNLTENRNGFMILPLSGVVESATDRRGMVDHIQERGKSRDLELGGMKSGSPRFPTWYPIESRSAHADLCRDDERCQEDLGPLSGLAGSGKWLPTSRSESFRLIHPSPDQVPSQRGKR